MQITDIKTFLVSAAHPQSGSEGVTSRHWDSRNWCFVKICALRPPLPTPARVTRLTCTPLG